MGGMLTIGSEPIEWVEAPGFSGFDLEIKYLTPERIRTLRKAATRKVRDPNTRQMVDQVDDEKFSKMMVKDIINNWRGLTPEVLQQLVPVSPESLEQIAAAGELPFSEDDLEVLANNTYSKSFMEFVIELATDLQQMREIQKVRLEKNSVGSSRT